MTQDFLTPQQVAKRLGVGTSTVKRWAMRGFFKFYRMPGIDGQRQIWRIEKASVEEFLRDRLRIMDKLVRTNMRNI